MESSAADQGALQHDLKLKLQRGVEELIAAKEEVHAKQEVSPQTFKKIQ